MAETTPAPAPGRDRHPHRETEIAIRRSEERFQTLVAASSQIVWTTDADGTFGGDQPDWRAFTGQSADQYGEGGWLAAIHPDDRERTERAWSAAVAGALPYEVTHRVRRHDGEYRYFAVRGIPILEADGTIREWVGTHTDITDRKRAEEEREFLIEASEVLSSSLDYDRTLATVARLATVGQADWCAIDVVEGGALRRVVVAHRDRAKAPLAARLLKFGVAADATAGAARAVRTREPELHAVISPAVVEATAHDAEHLALLHQLGIRSRMAVPMISRGEVLGAISFVSAESGRRYGEHDLELAVDLARRAAVAVDNARLYREAEEGRVLMEQQAIELEAQLEELQNQAIQLEENQAELEMANVELRQANADLGDGTRAVERANDLMRREMENRLGAQERLRESELSYRSLFDSLTDLVYLIDMDGNLLNVNAAVLRRYGYVAEELLGASPLSLEAPGPPTTPSATDRFLRAMAGEPQRFELWGRTKSGERFPKEVILTRGEYFGAPVVIAVGRDISERKRAEEALRESEEKFRQIAENIREVFWMFDADFTRTIYVSPAYEEIWGRATAEIYSDARAFLAMIHEDDMGVLIQAMDAAKHGVAARLEYRVLRDDGTVRWVWVRGFPIRDEHGTVYRIVGTAEDITERKQAEFERRAAEEHYRRLVETSPYGIYTVDAEGRFTEMNQAAADLLARPADDLIGRHFSAIVAPGEMESLRGRRRVGSAEDGATADYELWVALPSGERRLIHVRSARIGGAVELEGYHGIVRDITEERAREEEMRLLATALESLDEGVSVARFDGQLIYANSTHARLFGYDPAQGGLPNTTDFIPNRAEAQRLDEMFQSVAEHGSWVGRVRRQRMDDGRIVPFELIAGRVDRQGGDSVIFNITRDVTDEIQRERELRRVERLASVGTMVGGVAHELNNPLHAIRNFAELLLLDERSEDDGEALEIIQREADRAAKVVADLRVFARQTQEERGGRSGVDLNDVVRHVLKLRQYAMETRDVEIVRELDEELPRVWANRGELEQVVLNFVVNAEQAMAGAPGRHRLVVRTRPSEAGAIVQVIDSGVGIPADHLERIFDPFWTTKPPGEGTGLGLSLVHGIIREHGGEIAVESQVGSGSTFTVDLPRAGEMDEAATDEADEVPRLPTRSLQLLVVDDEASLRRAAERFLARRGHHVDTAADGATALQLLENREYDVIISDLRMPGMDGETLVRQLRERRPGLENRVVFVTGDAASAGRASDLGGGEIPVLIKPVRLHAVADLVERIAGAAPPPQGEP